MPCEPGGKGGAEGSGMGEEGGAHPPPPRFLFNRPMPCIQCRASVSEASDRHPVGGNDCVNGMGFAKPKWLLAG